MRDFHGEETVSEPASQAANQAASRRSADGRACAPRIREGLPACTCRPSTPFDPSAHPPRNWACDSVHSSEREPVAHRPVHAPLFGIDSAYREGRAKVATGCTADADARATRWRLRTSAIVSCCHPTRTSPGNCIARNMLQTM